MKKRDVTLIDAILGEREQQPRRYFEKAYKTTLLYMFEDFLIRLIEGLYFRINPEEKADCRDLIVLCKRKIQRVAARFFKW